LEFIKLNYDISGLSLNFYLLCGLILLLKKMIQHTEKNIKDNTDEIDLVNVIKKIWAERKLILNVTGVFFVLGIIIAFGTPK
jgi:hypothetical protein